MFTYMPEFILVSPVQQDIWLYEFYQLKMKGPGIRISSALLTEKQNEDDNH